MKNWLLVLLVALTVPQVSVAQSPAKAADSAQASTYRVGPQDGLKIEVFAEKELSGSFRVDSDGTISYPFLGRVPVQGLTLQEIGKLLQDKLTAGYVNHPQVSVEMEEFRSRHIFIMGEVKTAGKYPLQGDVTLLEILALAGSVTNEASDEVIVIRPPDEGRDSAVTPDSPSANLLTRIYLSDLRSGKQVGNVLLEHGDTIYVPAAERIYVSGHVRNPSSYVWKRGMTVEQAITLAGGVTERGSMRRLAIRRQVGPSPSDVKEFSVSRTDLVQPNDTIIVKVRFI